ncbi:Peptidyl-prolyl cis-trans isomerase FKBP16-3-chloroplastic [Striga hermonthica]|uniref:peptidylprolyl isomerase n=1 Tax=Striga hermonthica TaxID=68872 RepID=A0A9N7NY24_STRHE|nr:Peptidyl-prolyl cis-trans isomerase FKBP16-3-chloroplastic [Striga hermonthica]
MPLSYKRKNFDGARDDVGFIVESADVFICELFGQIETISRVAPEEKPRLCDGTCEKELENVCFGIWNLHSSLEKGQPYIFRVGSGQVIKGLDEGILGMKVGGKRRLYIPGPLAFPKGLASAPGRPRVAANSPVVFDVSLEYIPRLEDDE